MKGSTRLACGPIFFTIATLLLGWLAASPISAEAQGGQGQNTVYNGANVTVGSTAFIDASMFTASTTNNLCAVLNYVLSQVVQPTYPAGAVIDARGLPGTKSTSMTCTASPWAGITNPPPSTILLPAASTASTSGPIIIPTTWVLPSNTHLIGEGDRIPFTSFTPGTVIQACTSTSCSSSFSGSTMIQFADSSTTCFPPGGGPSMCTGISVENLVLDGQGNSVNGIVNQYASDLSYVDHVSLYQIRGTGLLVAVAADNSGPYSNITFDLGGFSGTSSTVCANLNGLSGTRGIHGLTCISANSDPPAAILLDSSNNSIQDVRIVGFYDGILVGENADAKSNVLINIFGDTASGNGAIPINAVHIPNSAHAVSDLSIVGLANIGGPANFSLEDDRTGPHLSDTSVGIYALGESASGGYSRFTTSPNAATWAVGSNYPSTGCTSANRGSLYSCIGSGTCSSPAKALWVCLPGGWTGIQ